MPSGVPVPVNINESVSFVITSRKDGAVQRLTTRTLWEWQNTSAYFNGDAVKVELFVGGNDVGVYVNIEKVTVGEVPSSITPDTQCGPNDPPLLRAGHLVLHSPWRFLAGCRLPLMVSIGR